MTDDVVHEVPCGGGVVPFREARDSDVGAHAEHAPPGHITETLQQRCGCLRLVEIPGQRDGHLNALVSRQLRGPLRIPKQELPRLRL